MDLLFFFCFCCFILLFDKSGVPSEVLSDGVLVFASRTGVMSLPGEVCGEGAIVSRRGTL